MTTLVSLFGGTCLSCQSFQHICQGQSVLSGPWIWTLLGPVTKAEVLTSEVQGRSTVKTPVSAWRKPGLDLLGDKSLLGQHQQQQIWAQQRLCKHWGAQPRPGWAVASRTMSLIQETVSSWCIGCHGATAWLVTQLCLADGAGLYSLVLPGSQHLVVTCPHPPANSEY